MAASEVFKKVWKECTDDERYRTLGMEFKAEQKEWDKQQRNESGKEEEKDDSET